MEKKKPKTLHPVAMFFVVVGVCAVGAEVAQFLGYGGGFSLFGFF